MSTFSNWTLAMIRSRMRRKQRSVLLNMISRWDQVRYLGLAILSSKLMMATTALVVSFLSYSVSKATLMRTSKPSIHPHIHHRRHHLALLLVLCPSTQPSSKFILKLSSIIFRQWRHVNFGVAQEWWRGSTREGLIAFTMWGNTNSTRADCIWEAWFSRPSCCLQNPSSLEIEIDTFIYI
jgi:hypothetical protein